MRRFIVLSLSRQLVFLAPNNLKLASICCFKGAHFGRHRNNGNSSTLAYLTNGIAYCGAKKFLWDRFLWSILLSPFTYAFCKLDHCIYVNIIFCVVKRCSCQKELVNICQKSFMRWTPGEKDEKLILTRMNRTFRRLKTISLSVAIFKTLYFLHNLEMEPIR